MLDFIAKSRNVLCAIVIAIFLLIVTVSIVDASNSYVVYCYAGNNKIGELSASKIGETYWIPVKDVAKILNMNISSSGDEVVVSNSNITVKIVKNASVAKVGNMIISLIEIPREIEGSISLAERSVNTLFHRALGKKTENLVSFRMENDLDSSSVSGNEKNKEPILYNGSDVRLERPIEKPTLPVTRKDTNQTPSNKEPVINNNMNETMIEISESSFGDETPQVKSEPDKEVKKTNTKAPAKSNIVVLDPGHGGQDPGAVANGIQEKNINLSIALKLEKTLESKGIKVELTRRTDVYLKLAERTEIANKLNAEVFVSIHANALPKGKSARGFEIYLMALPTDKDALELAKFENRELVDGKTNAAASDKRTQLLLSILGDMQQNHKIIESTDFAEVLFKAGNQSNLPMRRVAQAPFYVLRGAAMPAVLLETGFITDKDEAKLLLHSGYQQKIADAMALGIINYLRGK